MPFAAFIVYLSKPTLIDVAQETNHEAEYWIYEVVLHHHSAKIQLLYEISKKIIWKKNEKSTFLHFYILHFYRDKHYWVWII